MKPKRAILLLVVLAFLGPAGCVGIDRHPPESKQAPSKFRDADEAERHHLERELSLYSD